MNECVRWLAAMAGLILMSACAAPAAAQFAAAVVSYDAGATPVAGFTTPAAAIGSPERFTGEGSFPGVVSPFNPPFLPSEIVSVGEGGQITLRLSHYAIPLPGVAEIGVFTNVGLLDSDFPNGRATLPASAFGIDDALVEVSSDGVNWHSLGSITFDIPTNGYADVTQPFATVAGSVPCDFQQPFTGDQNSFSGLSYVDVSGPDMLDLLAGSGGGKWLDISSTGLSQVGFVRFSVSDDLDAMSQLNFELDAVSIARMATGAVVVPEPVTSFLVMGVGLLAMCRRRRR